MICKASSKEPIFRFKTCGLSAIFLLVIYVGIPLIPYMKPFFSLFIRFFEWIEDFELGADVAVFYDTSINLLVTSISTITIMSSFLNHRYLGANYKFWMFKYSPYYLTPQEDILLMVVNLVGYLPYMLCKKWGLLSFVSYLVSWWLFLYLMYQVYVYVIKVSHMFYKVTSRMIRKNKKRKWDEICGEIYKKLAAIRYVDNHNSYFSEEIELIIEMMIMYRNNAQTHDSDSSKREGLEKVVNRLIDSEAHIKCDQLELLKNNARVSGANTPHTSQNGAVYTEIEQARAVLVRKVVKKGNKLIGSEHQEYPYEDAKSAWENLEAAFRHWFP